MAIKRKNRDGHVYLEEYRSIRRGDKIVSKFVRYLGPEKTDEQKGYGPVLDRIERGPALHTGAVRLLWKLAQNLNFQETINRICNRNSRGSDTFSSTLLTVWAINRVLEPKSASKLQRWVGTTDLPEITGLPLGTFTKDAFLHSLDTICGDDASTGEQFDRSAELNKALSDHWRKEHPLPPNVKDVLAYDLTNVLFFGVTCPIAKKGCNEKHERRPQVNVEPVRHRLGHRVKEYILVCMLAYRLAMALRWLLVDVKLGGQRKTWYLNLTQFVEEGMKKIGMKSLLSETA